VIVDQCQKTCVWSSNYKPQQQNSSFSALDSDFQVLKEGYDNGPTTFLGWKKEEGKREDTNINFDLKMIKSNYYKNVSTFL